MIITNKVILLGGGSCSGKTSAVKHIIKIKTPPIFFHFDYDDQLSQLAKVKFDGDFSSALEYITSMLPKIAAESSFIMDHWMAPTRERNVRIALKGFNPFCVWLYCSSEQEMKRREKQRGSRGEGITQAGINMQSPLDYHYKLDTYKKPPKEVARLIYIKAKKYWESVV